MICRRDQRSSTMLTNGPMIENGSRVTASTAATEAASGCRSGEKRTYEASAICSTPSLVWVGDADAQQPSEVPVPPQVPQAR